MKPRMFLNETAKQYVMRVTEGTANVSFDECLRRWVVEGRIGERELVAIGETGAEAWRVALRKI